MGKANAKQAANDRPLTVQAEKGETERESMARVMIDPYLRHGAVTSALSDKMIGKLPGEPRFDDFGAVIKRKSELGGDDRLRLATEVLVAQAQSLDAIFTEYARRATVNIGEYINASERYMRIALKAQSGARATLETVVRLHQPREQTVKHVHINEGAQAVVADHFHAGGGENGKSNEQSHAAGAAAASPALPRPHPAGDGVPIPSSQREKAMQDARRDESGSS
jgi:hypothetical protein